MATPKVLVTEELSSDALSRDTDGKVDSPCTPCLLEEEKQMVSVVFCLECSEHLCETCRQHHRKLKLTRAHHLIEILKGKNAEESDENTTESCPEHPGKCIEYFCENDEALCCKTCREISHSGCDKVKSILDEVSVFVEKGGVLNTEKSLRSLAAKLVCQVEAKRKQTVIISDQAAIALIQIKTERDSTIKRINKLADEAENNIKSKSSDVKTKLQNEIETMESVLETLNVTEKCLNTVKQNAGEPQIYITIKKADHQLKKYSVYAEEIEQHMTETNVQFKINSTFQSILEKVTTFGTVIVGKSETPDREQQKQDSVSYLQVNNSRRQFRRHSSSSSAGSKRKKAIPVGGHSVRIPGDKTTCHVTGSKILNDGRIILADHNNKSIKLFNKNCNYIHHIALPSRPNDIVVIGENEIATSLIDESAIQIISVNDKLCPSRRIATAYPYYGLAFSDQQQFYGTTTMEDGTGEIHAMDISGILLGSIKKIAEQIDLIRPTAIYIDKSQLLYVNDLGRNSVFCLDISLGVSEYRHVFTYTDRNLELRSGIAVDTEGYVYISSGNMTVHQISFNGIKVHEILTSADGLGLPHCLAFSARDDHLLVSEFKENSFKLYALR